jgi:hypothetical protein
MVAATKAVSPALAVGPQWVGLSRPSEAGLMTALLMGGADAGTGTHGLQNRCSIYLSDLKRETLQVAAVFDEPML